MLEFWRVNFDQNFVRNIFTPKPFANTVNPINNTLGVYLITEILEDLYWNGLLKEEVLKNLEIKKN